MQADVRCYWCDKLPFNTQHPLLTIIGYSLHHVINYNATNNRYEHEHEHQPLCHTLFGFVVYPSNRKHSVGLELSREWNITKILCASYWGNTLFSIWTIFGSLRYVFKMAGWCRHCHILILHRQSYFNSILRSITFNYISTQIREINSRFNRFMKLSTLSLDRRMGKINTLIEVIVTIWLKNSLNTLLLIRRNSFFEIFSRKLQSFVFLSIRKLFLYPK